MIHIDLINKLLFAKYVLYYIVESFLPTYLSLVVYFCLYTPWYTPLYTSTCTLIWHLSGSLQSLCRNLLRINYQPISFQANLLSYLSTAMGLEHEPPLPNRVVNLQ